MKKTINLLLLIVYKILKKIIHSPLTATVLTIIVLLTGILGSIYSSEIRSSFPFTIINLGYQITTLFWLLVLISGILFFLRQRIEDEIQVEKLNELNETIRTIPPKDFLITFKKLYEEYRYSKCKIDELYANTNKDETYYISLINLLMQSLLVLTKKVDRSSEQAEYGMNIMINQKIEGISQIEIEKIKNRIVFKEPDLPVESLESILELKHEFSFVLKKGSTVAEKELDIEEIILPIPRTKKTLVSNNEKKYLFKVLPGAPIAFTEKALSRFENTDKILEWCDNKGDFTATVKSEINDYFKVKTKEKIKSMASIPLQISEDEILGVINIHSNMTKLLNSNEILEQFYQIILPILFEISDLVREKNKLILNQ